MRYTTHLSLGVLSLVAASLVACSDTTTTPTRPANVAGPSRTLTSNGFPQGSFDYHLNIIGVPQDKSATMDNNNGHRIFVQLYSDNTVTNPGGKNDQLSKGGGNDQNHIYLCNSTNGENDVDDPRCTNYWQTNYNQFGVIDANATDGDGGILAVPDPCADAIALTPCTPSYRIYARAHGNTGSATITTCADEAGLGFDGTDDVWCGSNGITLYAKGGSKAIEVSDNLLYMTITVNGLTDPQLAACLGTSTTGPQTLNVYLFDNCFENYFWNYDNNGLKNLELRFYSVS